MILFEAEGRSEVSTKRPVFLFFQIHSIFYRSHVHRWIKNQHTPPNSNKKKNKGGKIVIPKHIPRSGTSWENPNRGQIPLDRAGKHLPRYMQETNVSKTKLAFKHTDQNNAREHRKHSRAAKNQAVDLVGQHRQLVTQVKNLSVRLIFISSSHYILSMISTSSNHLIQSTNPFIIN